MLLLTKHSGLTYFPQTKIGSAQGQCVTNAQGYSYLGYPNPMCKKVKTRRNEGFSTYLEKHSPLIDSWYLPHVMVEHAGLSNACISQLFQTQGH